MISNRMLTMNTSLSTHSASSTAAHRARCAIVFLALMASVAALFLGSCKKGGAGAKPADVDYYTCTMHPSVKKQNLKERVGGNRIEIAVAKDADLARAAEVARRHFSSEVNVDPTQRRISAPSKNGTSQLAGLVRDFDGAGVDIVDLQLHRPSLDDVFLTLTGHQAEEEKAVAPTGRWRRRPR